MHPIKKEITNDIYGLVAKACDAMALEEHIKNKDAIKAILNLSHEKTYDMLRRTITAIPDRIFYLTDVKHREEVCALITKEFILFHAQEDWNNEDYPLHYISFLERLISDIDDVLYKAQV